MFILSFSYYRETFKWRFTCTNYLTQNDQQVIISPVIKSEHWIEKFIAGLDVKSNSKTTYTASIRQFLDFLQSYSITQPTRQDILTYTNYLQDKQLSSLTINNHLVSIKLFFKFLDQKKNYPNTNSKNECPFQNSVIPACYRINRRDVWQYVSKYGHGLKFRQPVRAPINHRRMTTE